MNPTLAIMHVYERSGATVMARVRGPEGEFITPAIMQAVHYSVFRVDDEQPVDGHSNVQLTVADHVFEPLQTDPRWRLDPLGYNFRHTLAPSALPEQGSYRVEYAFTPVQGARWWGVVRLKARGIWSDS